MQQRIIIAPLNKVMHDANLVFNLLSIVFDKLPFLHPHSASLPQPFLVHQTLRKVV